MPLPTSTLAWIFQNPIVDTIDLTPNSPTSTFGLKKLPLPSELPDDSALLKTLYLSNDPALRISIQADAGATNRARKKTPGAEKGAPMNSLAVLRVLKVGNDGQDSFKEGDIVWGLSNWSEYVVLKKAALTVVQKIQDFGPETSLGALGFTGLSAYFCLVDTLNLKETDTLVVSGAAGAVGNVAVQYAKKVLGVKRVVGIAGTEEKCEWVRSIGADAAVNYKSPTFAQDLINATPDGVDKYFDNVGGKILDEVLLSMNEHGIIGACGAISTYSKGFGVTLSNFGMFFTNKLELKGYHVVDYMARMGEGVVALSEAATSGKLKIEGAETIVDLRGKFEDVPKVWTGLFEGTNIGKLITKVAD